MRNTTPVSTSFTTAPRFSPSETSPSSTMKAVEDHVLPRRKKKEQREIVPFVVYFLPLPRDLSVAPEPRFFFL